MTRKERILLIFLVSLVLTFLSLFLIKNTKNEPLERYNIYLVYSPTCPHCENLIEFLETEGVGVEKISIENFYLRNTFRNLSNYFRGVPFVFAKVNDTIIIISGYPDRNQENDGYFLGKGIEEDLCIKANGTPVYINNTYSFCKLSENVLLGNRYSILWLIEQCKEYGCEKLE
ncbi:hypothetical protein BA065_01405 [Nanoarchaeota archaeon NZ13-N]|nr:MAG: hypothetical protein BA065_01405 [Nanoarchaeota archaeon NZ13-N]